MKYQMEIRHSRGLLSTPNPDLILSWICKASSMYGQIYNVPEEFLVNNDWDYNLNCLIPLIEKNLLDVKPEASPGVPWSKFGIDNKTVLSTHRPLIIDAVRQRLCNLLNYDIDQLSAIDLVKGGFCDPVRVFVKNEPHKYDKIRTRRFRIISSVSLVDQIVERVLYAHCTKTEIKKYKDIPSQPGMGFVHEDNLEFYSKCVNEAGHLLASTDCKGFDWTVEAWELRAEALLTLRLHAQSVSLKYRKLLLNRNICVSRKIFQTSGGQLYEAEDGIQPSGRFVTSFGNSHIRVIDAVSTGTDFVRAMGDDTVEKAIGTFDEASRLYLKVGKILREYELFDGTFEFCSHKYTKYGAYTLNDIKEFMRLCHREDIVSIESYRLALMQFIDDLSGTSRLNEMLDILSRVGWYAQYDILHIHA